jgi:hypothetical protein
MIAYYGNTFRVAEFFVALAVVVVTGVVLNQILPRDRTACRSLATEHQLGHDRCRFGQRTHAWEKA